MGHGVDISVVSNPLRRTRNHSQTAWRLTTKLGMVIYHGHLMIRVWPNWVGSPRPQH